MQDDNEDTEVEDEIEDKNKPVHLTGGTTEFKMEYNERFWPQTFANLARIANLLVVQSLELGCLVSSAQIWGLLTEYKTGKSIPMLFETNVSKILVGTELPFADCLAAISTNCIH